MMATIMNGLALTDAFNRLGTKAIFRSGINMECFEYATPKDKEEFDKNTVIVYGGGIGKPYYSTDTCSAIRAKDLEVDAIVKLTTVDGVYTADPKKDPTATKYDKIKFKEVIEKELGIMDMEAMEICRDNNINIIVTNINDPNALLDIINNKSKGTIVSN
jgi:uridylate kinase